MEGRKNKTQEIGDQSNIACTAIVAIANLHFEFPIELKGLKKLKFVDIHHNKFMLPIPTPSDQGIGFRIRF